MYHIILRFSFSFLFSQKWIPGPFTYLDNYPSSKKHLQFPKCIYFASIQQFPFLLDYLWELVYDERFNFLASHYLFELDIFFLIDVFPIWTSLHSYNTWFSNLVSQAYCQHSIGILWGVHFMKSKYYMDPLLFISFNIMTLFLPYFFLHNLPEAFFPTYQKCGKCSQGNAFASEFSLFSCLVMLSTQIKIGHCFEHLGDHCASCQMEFLRTGSIQSQIGKNLRQNKREQLWETV